MRYLFGSRYREATQQAVSNFLKKDDKHRAEQNDLKTSVYSHSKLLPLESYKEPTSYPDVRPKYSKGYIPSEYIYSHCLCKYNTPRILTPGNLDCVQH